MPNNEFGDFQTPFELASQCLKVLNIPEDACIFEPTCGSGAFLHAAASIAPSSKRFGIEVNPKYAMLASQWGKITIANVFQLALPSILKRSPGTPLFVVGNPPWVTSAELKRMGSTNLPPKENFKKVKGLDAILGSSNFDVCEYIILKVLKEFSHEHFLLGMLCKTQVARNVIDYAAKIGLPISNAAFYRIDALKWFNSGVDACWFIAEVNPTANPTYTVSMYKDVFIPNTSFEARFGVVNSRLVSDVDKYASVYSADGKSPYEWRSGLKHDASSVFELAATPQPTTKSGEVIDIEQGYVFPLLKSTDIFRGRHRELSKWVIVPQKEFGDETSSLRVVAPKLWNYLESNAKVLDGRKSSIYRNRPRFSVFGLGDYTFAPYKVAISGLHKQPAFRLIAPINDLPVVLDDTCYLLPFQDATEAAVVAAVLNSPECKALIESLVFWDSKRPITKKLLARIDLNRLPVDSKSVIQSAQTSAKEVGVAFNEIHAKSLIGHFPEVKERNPVLF